MAKKMKLKNFYAVSLVTLIVDAEGNPRRGLCPEAGGLWTGRAGSQGSGAVSL